MIYLQIDGSKVYPDYDLIPITVDSIEMSVDNDDSITADMTEMTSGEPIEAFDYLINTLVSFESDSISIEFKNELTQEVFNLPIKSFNYDEERLKAYFNYNFKEGDSFEVKVKDENGKIMRRETAYASSQKDRQNFRLTPKIDAPSQKDNGIIIMD